MAVTDKLNELQIKANLIADEGTGLMGISVEVRDGVAVLEGEVDSEEHKRIAEGLASEVEGIDEVVNDLKIVHGDKNETSKAHLGYTMAEGDVGDTAFAIGGESAGPGAGMASSEQFPGEFDDSEIEQEVRRKLDAQDKINVSGVKFTCTNQIVHVKGSVKTPEDLYSLNDMVLNVRGVMGINSNVTVKEGEVGTQRE